MLWLLYTAYGQWNDDKGMEVGGGFMICSHRCTPIYHRWRSKRQRTTKGARNTPGSRSSQQRKMQQTRNDASAGLVHSEIRLSAVVLFSSFIALTCHFSILIKPTLGWIPLWHVTQMLWQPIHTEPFKFSVSIISPPRRCYLMLRWFLLHIALRSLIAVVCCDQGHLLTNEPYKGVSTF